MYGADDRGDETNLFGFDSMISFGGEIFTVGENTVCCQVGNKALCDFRNVRRMHSVQCD